MTAQLTLACQPISHSDRNELNLDKCAELIEQFRRSFGVPCTILDGTTGSVVLSPLDAFAGDWSELAEVCRAVARHGRAEFILEEGPLVVLALPFDCGSEPSLVAVAPLVSRIPYQGEDLAAAARVLGHDLEAATAWIGCQTCVAAEVATRIANLLVDKLAADDRAERLDKEVEDLSLHLSSTYEEISLLYRLTQNLKLSSRDEDLARMSVEWLIDALPVESLAIQLVADADPGSPQRVARSETILITNGPCPVNCEEFTRLIEHLGLDVGHRPAVINTSVTGDATWPAPTIREMILVPLCEGHNLIGWVAAFNNTRGREFGTPEASLLSSVATILGIHSGNIELYRQQAQFVAGVVRALTSAIDAKDPYTCGHSDRVARVAVRIAEEMGCDMEQLNSIYLSGLLHDVGKIGIDDNVLRKPGMLTPAEYEHIKTHTEIGHRILLDIKQLDEVLPVVLHHHEQWDGQGYPHRLVGEQTPLMARIVAVADAFDAMGSDRPYRKGMAEEKLDSIIRAGAGKQWDPQVVEAYFRARDDIRDICARECASLTLDVQQWI